MWVNQSVRMGGMSRNKWLGYRIPGYLSGMSVLTGNEFSFVTPTGFHGRRNVFQSSEVYHFSFRSPCSTFHFKQLNVSNLGLNRNTLFSWKSQLRFCFLLQLIGCHWMVYNREMPPHQSFISKQIPHSEKHLNIKIIISSSSIIYVCIM